MVLLEAESCHNCNYSFIKKDKRSEGPKYELTLGAGKKLSCPVCSRALAPSAIKCFGCGYEFKKKPMTSSEPESQRTRSYKDIKKPAGTLQVVPISKIVSVEQVEDELRRLLSGKKQDLKLMREQIIADEKRINVMKIKLDAKIKIFEDQRQRYQAKLEILEKDLTLRKSGIEKEEKQIGVKEDELVKKIVEMRKTTTFPQEKKSDEWASLKVDKDKSDATSEQEKETAPSPSEQPENETLPPAPDDNENNIAPDKPATSNDWG